MPSNKKIKELYNEQLKPMLSKLENDRHAIQMKLVIGVRCLIKRFFIPMGLDLSEIENSKTSIGWQTNFVTPSLCHFPTPIHQFY